MIGLDANVVVRYLTHDDPAQSARARQIFEEQLSPSEPGYISLVTIAEIVWVLDSVYGIVRQDLVRAIDSLLAADSLFVQNEREVNHARVVLESGAGSFADALIGALDARAGCSHTLTFDRKASRLAGFRLA